MDKNIILQLRSIWEKKQILIPEDLKFESLVLERHLADRYSQPLNKH